ncbi:MAG: secretion protein [Bacteroidetes bacterium]|jgi:uncharacterized Ntn-hydrolase superfamily protein|nr:secretion protein [Bacteroidota bacterium]
MKKITLFLLVFCATRSFVKAQDTFSIVGIDTITGEVGSAGASCVDLIAFGIADPSFLGDLIPGKGAINTQASYLATNQNNARTRMNLGDTPAQIIAWLQANDAQSNPTTRQYGIAALMNGAPLTAGFTGTNCMNYKNHIAGINYCIQGNILLGQQILDSMESKFKKTPGTLACKLMAALQGAKVVGADTRCTPNNSSSLFAFLKVSKPSDVYGSPYISISVKTATNTFIEPIDSLQTIANGIGLCSITTGIKENKHESAVGVFPNPSGDVISLLNYSPNKTQRIVILNAIGQVVLEEENNFEKINVSSFPSGIYSIEIFRDNILQPDSRRWIKN